jgi:hypothetical protein
VEEIQWLTADGGEEEAAPPPPPVPARAGAGAGAAGRGATLVPEAAAILRRASEVRESEAEMAAALEAALLRTPAVVDRDVAAFLARWVVSGGGVGRGRGRSLLGVGWAGACRACGMAGYGCWARRQALLHRPQASAQQPHCPRSAVPHTLPATLCPPARAACRFAALTELKPLVFATLMGHHRAGRHDLVQTYVWHLICAP